jgi:hypothetical protein
MSIALPAVLVPKNAVPPLAKASPGAVAVVIVALPAVLVPKKFTSASLLMIALAAVAAFANMSPPNPGTGVIVNCGRLDERFVMPVPVIFNWLFSRVKV